MKNGFRQSMAWLHTWSGLLMGWLLFAIFFMGTLAFFRSEISYWMKPELHGVSQSPQVIENAIRYLEQEAAGARQWSISLPDERSQTVSVGWPDPNAEGGGRRRGVRVELNPATGQPVEARETRGGDFLYRFHFELYSMPRNAARWIVGIASMAMFVAMISGIITHKKIFSDFFTFRPAKGQRSWLDAHAVTAVLALPFHLMITYSGLLLLMATLLPWNGSGRERPTPRPLAEPPPVVSSVNPASIRSLMYQASNYWGRDVGRITVHEPGRETMELEFAPGRNTRLSAHSGSGSHGVERLRYRASSGELLNATNGPDVSATGATFNTFGSLHRARFAEPTLRWLFFLSGFGGTLMIASGMILWQVKRQRQAQHSGHRLVGKLNISGIAGLTVATATYFWANRLIPASMADRASLEISVFFIAWLALVVHPLFRTDKQAWTEQLGLAALLYLSLPILNAMTSSENLVSALTKGNGMLVGFDLVALCTGLLLLLAAIKLHKHVPTTRTSRKKGRRAANSLRKGPEEVSV